MIARSMVGATCLLTAALANAALPHQIVPPEFYSVVFTDMAGAPHNLASEKGRPLLINFWASWCAPCIKEMPALSALHQKYSSRGVKFIGIGVDNHENIAHFLKRVPVDYPVYQANADIMSLARQLGDTVSGLPFTVLIDKEGRIVWQKTGAISLDASARGLASDIEPAIESTLQSAAPK